MFTVTVTVTDPQWNRDEDRMRLDGRRDDGSRVLTLHRVSRPELGWFLENIEKLFGEFQLVLPR
jgi:hypothetical protein